MLACTGHAEHHQPGTTPAGFSSECPKGQVKDIFSANRTPLTRTYIVTSFLILIACFAILEVMKVKSSTPMHHVDDRGQFRHPAGGD
jgi:hypothetical protein